MAARNEEALLTFNVSVKKRAGTLMVMKKRLLWRASEPGEPMEIAMPHSSIGGQMVNSTTSSKVLLKITLTQAIAGSVECLLSFDSVSASSDREAVKGHLAQVFAKRNKDVAAGGTPTSPSGGTPNSASVKMSQVMAARKTALIQNKDLGKLHQELVMSNLVSEEDFWSTRQHLLEKYLARQEQEKGIPTAIIRPSSVSTAKQIDYDLTPEIIQSILKQNPPVSRAYKEYVPDRISEETFWKKFLQSQYFYGYMLGGKQPVNTVDDDIFDKFARDFDQEEQEAKKKKVSFDVLLDLTATEEDRLEGYGNRPDTSMQITAHVKPTINRLHRHAAHVLQNERFDTGHASAQDRFDDHLRLDDLDTPAPPLEEPLPITDPRRYFQATITKDKHKVTSEASLHVVQMFAGWQLDLAQMKFDGSVLQATLFSLFPEEDSTERTQVAMAANLRARQRVSVLHTSVSEVLRHFWGASAGAGQVAKATRMANTLRSLRTKLEEARFEDVIREDAEAIAHIQNLTAQVERALSTFERDERRRQERAKSKLGVPLQQ